jgi:hypothetical protein
MVLARRTLLVAGAGLVALPVGLVAWRLIDAGRDESRLLAALADPASGARIGARIAEFALPAVRREEAEARLVALAEGLPDERDALREAVRRRIAEDFAERRLVEVDGWQIALTEADLALLAFAVSPPAAARPSGSG